MIDDHHIIERMKVAIAVIFLAFVAAGMFGVVALLFYMARIGLVEEAGGLVGHIIWGFSGLIFMLAAGCGIHYAITTERGKARTF